MTYGFTVEKTIRLYMEIDAASDEEAEVKADKLYQSHKIEEDIHSGGSEKWDYSLVNLDSGITIVDWE